MSCLPFPRAPWHTPSKPASANARSAGFTPSDLITTLAALLLLLAIATPALNRMRAANNEVNCARNLKMIGMAALMYVNQDVRSGSFPRLYWDTTKPTATNYTGADSANSFGPKGPPADGPEANDVSGAFYLILKTQEIKPEAFVCPGTWAQPLTTPVQDHSNWSGRANLSYSYNNPYPTQHAVQGGWKFNGTVGSDFPMVADMNPGSDALLTTAPDASKRHMAAVNSPNHDGDGQNVLYCDGHIDWMPTPFAGAMRTGTTVRDNIYVYGGADTGTSDTGIIGPAQDAYDSVLLPTYLEGPQPPPPSTMATITSNPLLLALVGGVVLLVVLVVVVVLVTRRKRPGAAGPVGYPGYGGPPPPPPPAY